MFDQFFEHVSQLVYYVLVGLISLILILATIFLVVYITLFCYKLIEMIVFFTQGKRYFHGEFITNWLWEKFNCVQRINQRDLKRPL